MGINLEQSGGGVSGTTLTGTGIARNTGACTELSGDVTTSGSNATTLKNTGTAGTYPKVTTDAQGRVTSGTTLSSTDIPVPLTISDTAANADLIETNTTTATSGTTNGSPTHRFSANYWTGAASAADTWTIGSTLAAGTNGASTLSFAHTGSTGSTQVLVPSLALFNTGQGITATAGEVYLWTSTPSARTIGFGVSSSPSNYNGVTIISNAQFGWASGTSFGSADTGVSRLGAGSIAVGNGTVGDFTGSLKLNSVTEASANGATWTQGQSSELLTLSTSGLTTDTTGLLLPAGAIIEAVVCRVTTTITTTTNWAVGDSVQSARFSSPNATLTAGTTSIGLNQADPTVSSSNLGPVQNSAAKVRITCTGSNPGAGAIRITVFYRQFVAPTS